MNLHQWLLVFPYKEPNLVNLYRDHQQAYCFPCPFLNHALSLNNFSSLLSHTPMKLGTVGAKGTEELCSFPEQHNANLLLQPNPRASSLSK